MTASRPPDTPVRGMVPVGMVEVVEIAGVMIIEGEVEMGGGSGGFGGSPP